MSGRRKRRARIAAVEALEGRALLSGYGPPTSYRPGRVVDAALGDFNGDGRVDVLTIGGSGLSVLPGLGDGTFGGPIGSVRTFPEDGLIATADVNDDGRLDVAISRSGSLDVRLGLGDGTFAAPSSYPAGSFPEPAVAADFDGDGAIDLAIVNNFDASLNVYRNRADGTGTFEAPATIAVPAFPAGLSAVDADGDGAIDLVFGSSVGGPSTLLRGRGDGTFADPGTLGEGTESIGVGRGPIVADLDGDGRADLLTIRGATIAVRPGLADGGFGRAVESIAPAGFRAHTMADFDADGDLDLLATAHAGGRVGFLLNDGRGRFTTGPGAVAGEFAARALAADFDGDGVPDLAVVSGLSADLTIVLSSGRPIEPDLPTVAPPPVVPVVPPIVGVPGGSGTSSGGGPPVVVVPTTPIPAPVGSPALAPRQVAAVWAMQFRQLPRSLRGQVRATLIELRNQRALRAVHQQLRAAIAVARRDGTLAALRRDLRTALLAGR